MSRYLSLRARPIASLLALVMVIAFAAPPAAASETDPPAPVPPQKPTIAAATKAVLAKADVASAVTIQEPAASSDSKPFFKTTKGMVVLALMIGGTAYTLYSKFNDRVHSPLR